MIYKGIGRDFASILASQGFNIIVISRTKEKVDRVSDELESEFQVKTGRIVIDLEHFPSDNFKPSKLLNDINNIIGNEKLRILVCNAGNSDLAVHFTDKTLERNISLMKLNMISTVSIIQTLIPRLVQDGKDERTKGGIITLSAITAFIGAPTFAVSAANKSFIRNFSLSIRAEFKDHLRVLVANPLAVRSNIVKNEHWNAIESIDFVNGVLKAFSKGDSESAGPPYHDVQAFYYRVFASQGFFNWFYYATLDENSRTLERKIDKRPLEEKLKLF